HVWCRADAQWLRLLDRGDRPVRHRRNSAHDGRRLEFPRQASRLEYEGRAPDLGEAATLLAALPPLLSNWLLDGYQSRRRYAGLIHELRHCQTHLKEWPLVRYRPDGRRDRAGNRGARRRYLGAAADDRARRSRFAHRR